MPTAKKPAAAISSTGIRNTRSSSKKSGASMRKVLAGQLPEADIDMAIFVLMLTRLSRINETISAAISEEFSAGDRLVLAVLLMEVPLHRLSPSALADRIVQTPGGMTKTLQRLESQGLVRRLRDDSDRRAFLVELTPAGIKATQKTFYKIIDGYTPILATTSNAERKDIARVLRSLLTIFESATGVRNTEAWLN